jgi:hypothetical protein
MFTILIVLINLRAVKRLRQHWTKTIHNNSISMARCDVERAQERSFGRGEFYEEGPAASSGSWLLDGLNVKVASRHRAAFVSL